MFFKLYNENQQNREVNHIAGKRPELRNGRSSPAGQPFEAALRGMNPQKRYSTGAILKSLMTEWHVGM